MNISRQVNLQPYNTLAIEVYADYFAKIENLADLQAARDFCVQQELPWLLIGGGSNLILTEDFAGLVMLMAWQGREQIPADQLQTVKAARLNKSFWRIGAGEVWDEWVDYSLQQQAYGLQNLSLIPGTVGAAPIQNIGAYGADIAQVLAEVEVFDFTSGEVFYLSADECQLAYRDSIFKQHTDWLVTQVTFALSAEPNVDTGYGDIAGYLEQQFKVVPQAASPQQVREAVIAIRQTKLPDPSDIPNVGSFFKNPVISNELHQQILLNWPNVVAYPVAQGQVKLAAGWLIDQLGWKGHRQHGVGVHAKQALVLIREQSSAAGGKDVLALAKTIQADVKQQFAVDLEIEPRLFNSTGEI
jgi:UDP-N-acetylmuramate dehydrogenase